MGVGAAGRHEVITRLSLAGKRWRGSQTRDAASAMQGTTLRAYFFVWPEG